MIVGKALWAMAATVPQIQGILELIEYHERSGAPHSEHSAVRADRFSYHMGNGDGDRTLYSRESGEWCAPSSTPYPAFPF